MAEKRQGPRGREKLTDEADRNKASNIILLCREHHAVIDDNPHVYSVHVLRQLKADHESRMAAATETKPITAPSVLVKEVVHSTLLRVSQLPISVYSGPCDYTERQKDAVREMISYKAVSTQESVPFLLRENHLFAFQDLTDFNNPFAKIVNPLDASPISTIDFCSDSEGRRRMVGLLNTAITKHCGRRKVLFDRDHHRYHFVPLESGVNRTEKYLTVSGRNSSRNVVWNPVKRSTGEGRPYWYHLAAGLSFHQMADDEWCLSIRPERHITKDGEEPYNLNYVGRKVTSLKARMFNDKYLEEVHFWRDFLSRGKPRFILDFGKQSAIIETELISIEVDWPGIPDDEIDFSNQIYDDDLFSFGELQYAMGRFNEEQEDEFDEEEE
ncbi:MAG: hypothetical protein KDN22_28000 [Verrucomicrobiae bacterium]|nr:hypothetical protein [Verrucomicrobiae bacterium]